MSGCHCPEQENYQIMISAAVDGALSPEEHRRLMAHLADCPACRQVYEQTLQLHQAFLDWEEPALPGDLTAAVMRRVRGERGRSARRSLRRFAAMAACLALVLCGARLLPHQDRPDTPAVLQGAAPAAEADQAAALPGSAAEGIPSAEPQLRIAAAPSEEQQIMEGVITYFNNAPPESAEVSLQTEKQSEDAAALSVPTLSSSDPELLNWMTENIAETGYSPDDQTNRAEATAWLITGQEYEALQAHIAEVSMEYEMDWGEAPAVMATAAVGEEPMERMICVVYIEAEE